MRADLNTAREHSMRPSGGTVFQALGTPRAKTPKAVLTARRQHSTLCLPGTVCSPFAGKATSSTFPSSAPSSAKF